MRDAIQRIESKTHPAAVQAGRPDILQEVFHACLRVNMPEPAQELDGEIPLRQQRNTVFLQLRQRGVSRIDLKCRNQCRGASSIKLYSIMNCWAAKRIHSSANDAYPATDGGRKDYYKDSGRN